ncbi:major facilitator superfamily domain-containing protein [Circinella umbellata]|nr:major facilitator superfamily domain-containing protein [Circinella umbellata]
MSPRPSHSIDGNKTTLHPDSPTAFNVFEEQLQRASPPLAALATTAAAESEAGSDIVDDDDDFLYQDSDVMLQPENNKQYLKGIVHIKGANTTCKIIWLTICLAGLQFTWTVEMAYGTPYLLSLGLTKSVMSLVWIAGPLSGLLMQPIVGVLSDRCTSKLGRRRPFIILGCIAVVLTLLVIGWTREITALFTGGVQEGDAFKHASIGVAITAIYVLDFSINCIQASCRALLVDALPPSQQEDGTAWAGRMVGLGNVAGYFMQVGYADLVKAFPFLGDTQLKVLCVIAAIVLVLSDIITCYAVTEKILTKEPKKKKKSWGAPFKALTDITTNIWNLPKPIRRICNVQFFAWIGWFPFLFYSTTWVAEIYDQNAIQSGAGGNGEDSLGQATRAGSFAFLVYSIISLAASFILPWIVVPSYNDETTPGPTFRFKIRRRYYTITPSKYLKISFLNLPRAWTVGHIIFLISMLATVFVSNVTGASVVIGICGVSWALTMWAPFSLLGEYIAEMEEKRAANGDDGQYHSSNVEHRIGMNRMAMSSRISLVAGQTGLGTEGGLYQLVEQFDTDGDSDNERREVNDGIELHDRRRQLPQQQQDELHRIEATSRNIDEQQQVVTIPKPPDSNNVISTPSDAMMMAPLNDHIENGKDSLDFNINEQSAESSDRDVLLGNNQQEDNNDNHFGRRRSSPTGTTTMTVNTNIPSAGVLLGIHNMYIVAPQFLVTFFSSVMFHFLEKNSSEGEETSPDAIGVVLRFGALMAGIAAFLSSRIGRPYK